MRVPESDRKSNLSVSPDLGVCSGPLGGAMGGGPGPSNGHTNGNSLITHMMKAASAATNGVHKHGKSVARVNLPGTTLYEDSFVDREEFIRLVIQSLRDVGYKYVSFFPPYSPPHNVRLKRVCGDAGGRVRLPLEAPEVSEFRRYVQDGLWVKAENSLMRLGIRDDEGLWDARFLISQQKYLELLEAGKTTAALHVLRNELAPLDVDPDHLHTLSSFIMCSEPDDLRRRAGWDGASGNSRQRLLTNLHRFIPSTIMIPQRRFSTLLHQARSYQRQRCVYHNSPSNSSAFSLYTDHQCNKSAFPRTTTTILTGHTDEVWNMEWSHDGTYLASASRDKTVIIWRIEVSSAIPFDGTTITNVTQSRPESSDSSIHDWGQYVILRNHPYPVGCLAWSLDDSVLLTSAEHHIKMWNAKTGVCMRDLEDHSEPVTALAWLPDGSGFISGGLDRRIILWDADGSLRDSWGATAIRVTDLAITPDFTRLVTVGIPAAPSGNDTSPSRPPQVGDSTSVAAGGNPVPNGSRTTDNQMIVYDLNTKQVESSTRLDGELTSVKLSQNSQYALINHAPNEIHLWDLNVGQLARKFTGLQQGKHVIRSCFGGIDDANVYVWHRDTGTLLEVLSGHGEGSVNSVAWNPRNERMFASCSDDQTVRIWEALPPEMMEDSSSASQPDLAFMNGKGKGKTRQHWDGDDVDVDSDFTSSR
ncbi:WD40 repeat-like protein [Infundibulicybe gibba]|nr:WD40 repeat-like protein [Infundibulicybe gibba]